jgi:lipopolysaccharide transport system ATP-binding protein
MSDVVISVENLAKRYLVGHRFGQNERYTPALRDVISREIRNFARRTVDVARGRQIVQGDEIEEFWALQDVSFEVKQGEVLAIIGRNGAGKSTLLKILSQITEPDRGRIELCGRVASLLEVGTGFHPELTGRENIFLNGAILGMKKTEIKRRFDEIVAFSGVERFLDTPVKQYSFGMYLRLAFSVAVHLEPEILIIDEVLAVGDFDFQRKCLQKMQDVASKEGRTVLLVSHNMAAIESMCETAILLAEGRCIARGDAPVVITEYLRDMDRACSIPLDQRFDRKGSGDIRFVSVSLEGTHGAKVPAFRCGTEATIHFVIENRTTHELRWLRVQVGIENEMGQGVAALDTLLLGYDISGVSPGRSDLRLIIPKMPLMPGRYRIRIYSEINGVTADWIRDAAIFEVEPGDFYGSGHLPAHNAAIFLLDHRFVLNADASAGRVNSGQDDSSDQRRDTEMGGKIIRPSYGAPRADDIQQTAADGHSR